MWKAGAALALGAIAVVAAYRALIPDPQAAASGEYCRARTEAARPLSLAERIDHECQACRAPGEAAQCQVQMRGRLERLAIASPAAAICAERHRLASAVLACIAAR